MKIARKFNTTVTVRGAGTGLVGSALNSGIILDLKKLNKIKIGKNFAQVEPGVVKGVLDKKLEAKEILSTKSIDWFILLNWWNARQ